MNEASRTARGRAEAADAVLRAWPRGDAHYPGAFGDLHDPPAVLWGRGRWPLAGPAVAIVGSRAATTYGRGIARRLAADLAAQGVVVVSGLARGVDAAAHEGALDAGGRTIAVLPGGVDRIVPASHHALATRIMERGACVSEQPPGAAPFRGRFIERNRLIAALAGATVVVEAARVSGALSTARAARRLGRALFAVPGDVDRETSRGCHALLRDGARLCEGAADVLAALERAPGARADSGALERVAAALSTTPRSVEHLARVAGVAPHEAARLLLRLGWSGVAVAHPGQRWMRAT